MSPDVHVFHVKQASCRREGAPTSRANHVTITRRPLTRRSPFRTSVFVAGTTHEVPRGAGELMVEAASMMERRATTTGHDGDAFAKSLVVSEGRAVLTAQGEAVRPGACGGGDRILPCADAAVSNEAATMHRSQAGAGTVCDRAWHEASVRE